jgi:hypothetical protein
MEILLASGAVGCCKFYNIMQFPFLSYLNATKIDAEVVVMQLSFLSVKKALLGGGKKRETKCSAAARIVA